MSKEHHTLATLTAQHGVLWQSVADAAALAALTIVAEDVSGKKVIRQTDTGEYWVPVSTAPAFERLVPPASGTIPGTMSAANFTNLAAYVAQKIGTFPIVSTSYASGTTQPTVITDAAMAGITGTSTAGGKTGTGATDGTLGVVAGSFASSGAETGTGGTQGGLGSSAASNQPYNTTDFPGGRYSGSFTKNGKDVLLAQMLSTALTDLDAVVTPFFAFRSDAAADSKWRVWWYYTRSSDGLLVPFTPTTSVTGQLSCPQVALLSTLPASAGFTNEAAGAGVNQIPAGVVGDLVALGTTPAIGLTGRYMDAGTRLQMPNENTTLMSLQIGPASPYTILTTDSRIHMDTSGGTAQANLPAPTAGRRYYIFDYKYNAATNNITVHRNGSEKINGLAADYIIQNNGGGGWFYADGTDWYTEQ